MVLITFFDYSNLEQKKMIRMLIFYFLDVYYEDIVKWGGK